MGKVCERMLKVTLLCIIVVGCGAEPHWGEIPPPLPHPPSPSIIPQHHHHHHLEPSPGPEPLQYPQHHHHLEPSPGPEPSNPPEAYNPTIQEPFPFPGPDYLPPPIEPVNPTIPVYAPLGPPLHSSLQQAPSTPPENRFSSFVGSFYSTPDDDAAQGAPSPHHHAA